MNRFILLFILTVLFFTPGHSQSVLSAGDIALLGANCDNPDDFAFLLLRDIAVGTTIKFTDNGWLASGGFRGGEGVQTFTASSDLPAGTVVVFSQNSANFSSSGSFSLAATGDQVLAYQGLESAPVMLYALNIAGAGVWQSDATSTSTSALPAGLINGQTAVAVQEFDNVKYGGSTRFSSPLAALISISDLNQWVGDDNNRFDFTAFGDFSLPVQLSSFTAQGGNEEVTLQWVTESEQGNLGFEILRAPAEEGEYVLLSSYLFDDGLKGHLNSHVRHTYQFVDRGVINGQVYWYRLADVDVNGTRRYHGPLTATPRVASDPPINDGSQNLPESFRLYPNHPNPFNPRTTIKFDIPFLKDGAVVTRLKIYNAVGQEVKTLYDGYLAAGSYQLGWDGSSETGRILPAGIYYLVLRAGFFNRVIRMNFVK